MGRGRSDFAGEDKVLLAVRTLRVPVQSRINGRDARLGARADACGPGRRARAPSRAVVRLPNPRERTSYSLGWEQSSADGRAEFFRSNALGLSKPAKRLADQARALVVNEGLSQAEVAALLAETIWAVVLAKPAPPDASRLAAPPEFPSTTAHLPRPGSPEALLVGDLMHFGVRTYRRVDSFPSAVVRNRNNCG